MRNHLVHISTVISMFLMPATAKAQDYIGIEQNVDPDFTTIRSLTPSMILTTLLNLLLQLAGVFSFIFLLIGGIQWILAGGDKDAIEKARRKVVQALIGLVIVFSAYSFLFALRTLFNINLIQFNLGHIGEISSQINDPNPPAPGSDPWDSGIPCTNPTDPGCDITPPSGMCACGGSATGRCIPAGTLGSTSVINGPCFRCESNGSWTPLGTTGCGLITCIPCN